MAASDYCRCEVCGGKSFYDAGLQFERVKVGDETLHLPVRCGDYAGLCQTCAATHKLVAVERVTPVSVTLLG